MQILFGLLYCCIAYSAATFRHLQCYHDRDSDYDLDGGNPITYEAGALTVEDCLWQCRQRGMPYAGIRRATVCFCGLSYGTYGQADTINCNFTCDSNFYCGGINANSIYYTIDSDDDSDRQHWAYGSVATFSSARQACVGNNGDLATLRSEYNFNDSVALFDDFELTENQNKFWWGLRLSNASSTTENHCEDYAWVNEHLSAIDCDANADAFQDTESFRNECVVVDMGTGQWETTSCYAQFPYLCFSVHQGDEDNDQDADYDVAVKEDEVDNSSTRMALFIVLPFFFFCYGGSCLLYCIHKLYRNCKRRRRAHMLLERQDSFTEFEPDTKPNSKPAIVAAGKKNRGFTDGPADESQPEPMHGKKGSLTSSRPTTSDAVRIDMNSPPGSAEDDNVPGYYKKNKMKEKLNKMKAEKRRAKLLENALMEARQRRNIENPSDSPHRPAPESTAPSTQSGNTASHWTRQSRYKASSPESGQDTARPSDSKASLLDDERKSDSPDDPTAMSIADILRVKMMMKEKKKRVRKILLS